MGERRLFSSESVTQGHPDKLCDLIADSVLDSALEQDPDSRVGCEVFIPDRNLVVVGGEITTKANLNIETIAQRAIIQVGYIDPRYGLDLNPSVISAIKRQSPDIGLGVDAGTGLHKEQGAGDQGMVFGFAVDETPEYMPLAITLAHRLVKHLDTLRKQGGISWLRPVCKSLVTVSYNGSGNPEVDSVVVSAQHDENIAYDEIRRTIIKQVIEPVIGCKAEQLSACHINPTGRFVIGGPEADAGLTGRKIIVDSYGGGSALYPVSHGGGAFSGKDPSKVDRSGAYAARYIAKNIVAAGLATTCLVQIAYAIGLADPVSLSVHTYGTATMHNDAELAVEAAEVFPLKPADIISHFDLKKPIYAQTSAYGHFGRPEFPWEQTDKVVELSKV